MTLEEALEVMRKHNVDAATFEKLMAMKCAETPEQKRAARDALSAAQLRSAP